MNILKHYDKKLHLMSIETKDVPLSTLQKVIGTILVTIFNNIHVIAKIIADYRNCKTDL